MARYLESTIESTAALEPASTHPSSHRPLLRLLAAKAAEQCRPKRSESRKTALWTSWHSIQFTYDHPPKPCGQLYGQYQSYRGPNPQARRQARLLGATRKRARQET